MKTAAKLKVELTSKRVGFEHYRKHRIGTRCQYERSSMCLGEFLIYFGSNRYAKIDAKDLFDTVEKL